MGLTGLAVCCLIGAAVCVQVGCAESKLQKQITAQQATAATADAAGAAAAQRAAADKAAIDAATLAATGPDGKLDAQKFYAALAGGAVPLPAVEKPALQKAVDAGTTPNAAASALLSQAQADAAKYAQQAADAKAQVASLQSQLDAAKKRDDSAWSAVQSVGSGVAGALGGPGIGALIGGALGVGITLARGKGVTAAAVADAAATAFTSGQTDGAAQVAQGVATIRRLSPAVDDAFNKVGPLVKAVVSATMDDHVADAVAANKDTVAPDAAPAVLATVGPAPLNAAAA